MKFIILLFVVVLTGCASSLKNKEKATTMGEMARGAQAQQTTLERFTEGEPIAAPALTMGGTNNTATIVIGVNPNYKDEIKAGATSDLKVQETHTETSFLKSKFPLWVSLIGLGVAGFVILALIWTIRRSSKAADATFRVADNSAAKMIAKVEAVMQSSTDEKTIGTIALLKADMEKHRGILNAE